MLKQRDYQAAAEFFTKANKLDDDYWDAQNYLGYAYYSLGLQQKAEEAFQRAIDIDPENAVAYANLGIALLKKGDYALAEKCGDRALRLFPSLPQANALLGILEINQHQWTARAHKFLEEAAPGIPAMSDILRRWPTADQKGPKIMIMVSTLR